VEPTEARAPTAADVPALSAMLARAFHDDPVTEFMLRSEVTRPRYAARFFSWQFRRLMGHELVHVAGDGEGAALWAPPDRWRETAGETLRLVAALLPAIALHLPSLLRTVAEVERRHPREPHLYLAVLGTDPPAQGRGVGSAAIAPGLALADSEGLPAYLETAKERNLAFYARFGFRVTDEFRLPAGGPTLWCMWRTPGFT
jgi:GNAT superfamily N-acetyltransferase